MIHPTMHDGAPSDAPLRLLVVDDQALVRAGFRMILDAEPDLDVIGEAGDGLAAIEQVAALQPDVVLMDIRMPELDGIEATRRILSAGSRPPKVLVLTTFDADEHVFAALQAGASGFLLKDTPPERLADGIRTVARGEALLSPSITQRLIARFAQQAPVAPAEPPAELADLTPRELEVLRLMARGLSNGEIAAELILGETTVKTHVGRVLMKLGLRDRVQAVVLAYETGIAVPQRG